jgi:pimeloyl-ACP methyl ester carboxylesterase
MEPLSEFYHPGTEYQDEMVSVSPTVSLRVVTFSPPQPSKNPPIVFVPGWITQMNSWQEVLRALTKDFIVYYIETREKISSHVKGKVAYSVEALAKDIATFISNHGLKKNEYILFGSSLGATAILDACRFIQQSPLCLILIGPNAVFRVPKFGMVIIHVFYPGFYLFVKPFIKWYLKNFRLNTDADYAQYQKYCGNLDAADPWKLKKAALAFSKYEVWDLLDTIDAPTLIVGASKDTLHEPKNLERMVSMMPNATYLDMETNKITHSKRMVDAMRQYIARLK